MSTDLPNHRVVMIRQDLLDLPRFELPPGCSIRRYQPGDEYDWVAVEQAAEQFQTITMETWQKEFGHDPAQLHRQLFLCCGGEVMGTASAWYGDEAHGREVGRVHWVAIKPQYQGQGLSKPLMFAVLRRCAKLGHQSAYLVTSTARLAAIHLYCRFGFEPELLTADDRLAWSCLRGRLPILEPFLPTQS